MKKKVLLILDFKYLKDVKLKKKKVKSLFKDLDLKELELYIIPFSDEPLDVINKIIIKKYYKGNYSIINPVSYFDKYNESVKKEISVFISNLRKRLENIVKVLFNKKGQDYFGRIWWYTYLSEKNSPANETWWILYRALIIDKILQEETYSLCIFLGSQRLFSLIKQICDYYRLKLISYITMPKKPFLLKLIILRIIGLIVLLMAVITSRYRFLKEKENKKVALIYTYFPRNWLLHKGFNYDRYYYKLPEKLKNLDINPIYVFIILDNINQFSLKVLLSRFRELIKNRKKYEYFIIAESFCSLKNIIINYFNIYDILNFLR